jgi:hypothetical protein
MWRNENWAVSWWLLPRPLLFSAFFLLHLLYCSVFFLPWFLMHRILCSSLFQFLADITEVVCTSNFWSVILFLLVSVQLVLKISEWELPSACKYSFLAGAQNFTVSSVSWWTRMQWALLCPPLVSKSSWTLGWRTWTSSMLQVPPCPFWIVCRASVIAAGFTHYHRPRFQPALAILFISLHFAFAQLLKHLP